MDKSNMPNKTRNSLSIFAILVVSLVLNACGTIYSAPLERREAAFNPQAEAAIIIATIGDKRVTKLRDTKGGAYTAFYTFVPAAGTNSVYMLPVPIGKVFGFTEVTLLGDNLGAPLIARIRKPERLSIDKPGIYYYGILYTTQEKLYIQRQTNQQVINSARKKYPRIFTQARPVNF